MACQPGVRKTDGAAPTALEGLAVVAALPRQNRVTAPREKARKSEKTKIEACAAVVQGPRARKRRRASKVAKGGELGGEEELQVCPLALPERCGVSCLAARGSDRAAEVCRLLAARRRGPGSER